MTKTYYVATPHGVLGPFATIDEAFDAGTASGPLWAIDTRIRYTWWEHVGRFARLLLGSRPT